MTENWKKLTWTTGIISVASVGQTIAPNCPVCLVSDDDGVVQSSHAPDFSPKKWIGC